MIIGFLKNVEKLYYNYYLLRYPIVEYNVKILKMIV